MNTTDQIGLPERLSKVAEEPVVGGSGPGGIIGICSNKDSWNRAARLDQASIELDSRHPWHINISDQAGSLLKKRGCEKIVGRAKIRDRISQRFHESFQGLADELIVVDYRDYWLVGQHGLRTPVEFAISDAPTTATLEHEFPKGELNSLGAQRQMA